MSTEKRFRTVTVIPFTTTDDVVWTGRDGKPRCARHPHICLVPATAIGLHGPGHLCAVCMKEQDVCASCGDFDSEDNELITDAEGSVFCEACWSP